MTINFSNIEFDNDMYYIVLIDGSILIITKIDECFESDNMLIPNKKDLTSIRRIILSRYNTETESVTVLSSIINSTEQSSIMVKSDYKIVDDEQISGKMLTQTNMQYCYIDINDEWLLQELL